MAESIEIGCLVGESGGMMTMLSNQMNPQALQQQMFQQSFKMQMDALEKHAQMSKKYLRRIARNIGGGGKKHKRDKDDSSSSSSSDDDKDGSTE